MAADELNTPLGQRKSADRLARLKRYRLPFSAGQAIAVLCGLFLAAFIGFALFGNNPLGGEPGVRISVDPSLLPARDAAPAQKPATASTAGSGPAMPAIVQGQTPPAQSPPEAAAPAAGQKTITIIDGSSGQRRDVLVPAPDDGRSPPKPDRQSTNEGGLFETSRYGDIPVISPAGIKPMQAYAQPAGISAETLAGRPVLALVVNGLGIGAARTEQAIAALPRGTTLGFVPYGGELASLVAKARQSGHEIVLQIPMEPFDYPDNDPGPQTLLTSTGREQNLDRLAWHLSRIRGYVGIANFMGGRFMASDEGMRTLMGDLKKRGLVFLDDGASLRSAAGSAARADGVPFVRADVIIDTSTGAGEIDKALARLEAIARQNGAAVGVASALPVSLNRIEAWAGTLESRGISLVPLTSVIRKVSSS